MDDNWVDLTAANKSIPSVASRCVNATSPAVVVTVVPVKACFNSETRRCDLQEVSFALLVDRLKALFGVSKDELLNVLYVDDEKDLITMTSDQELQYAIKLSKGLLRIELKRAVEDSAAESKGWGKHDHPHPHPHPHFRPEGPFHPVHGGRLRHLLEGRGRGHCHHVDVENDVKLVARHVKDVTILDGEEVLPGTAFVKTWRIRSEGAEWPAGCVLMFVSRLTGDQMSGPDSVPVEGSVAPGREIDISVPLVAPTAAGAYTGFWRLCTPGGKKFGQRLRVSISVPASSSSDSEPAAAAALPQVDEEKVRTIEAMGFSVKRARIEKMLIRNGGDVNRVVNRLTNQIKTGRIPPQIKK